MRTNVVRAVRRQPAGQSKPRPHRRFLDIGNKYQHDDGILVQCPKCDGVGRIMLTEVPASSYKDRRFACSKCLYRAEWRSGHYSHGRRGDACDAYLRLPLYLQVRTRHGTLYAYNEAHLAAMEAFVAAELRERRKDEFGWRLSSMARLPLWAKAAKNRAEVLRALARLRRRCADLPDAARTAKA